MTEKEIRVFELVARRQTLKQMEEGLEKEVESKAMTMFAKALDENFDAKMITTKTLLGRWIKEVDKELDELSQEVFRADALQEVEGMKERAEVEADD